MAEFKSNAKQLAASLRRRRDEFSDAIVQNWKQDGESFIAHIVRTQMTGRPGLNVQTGALRRSWWKKVRRLGKKNVQIIIGTSSKYAASHEKGLGNPKEKVIKGRPWLTFKLRSGNKKANKWVKVKEVRIPKRLNVIATWETYGKRLLILGIRRAIKGVFLHD